MEYIFPASLLENFHFLRPLWLLALVPALLLLIALWRLNSNVTAWDRAIDKELLPIFSIAARTPHSAHRLFCYF